MNDTKENAEILRQMQMLCLMEEQTPAGLAERLSMEKAELYPHLMRFLHDTFLYECGRYELDENCELYQSLHEDMDWSKAEYGRAILAAFHSGALDNCSIRLSALTDDVWQFCLSRDEYKALQDFMDDLSEKNIEKDETAELRKGLGKRHEQPARVSIKRMAPPIPLQLQEWKELILKAIRESRNVYVDYLGGDGAEHKKEITPLACFNNLDDNSWYFVDADYRYRLDRLIGCTLRGRAMTTSDGREQQNVDWKRVWGVNYEEKTHVKLRIYPDAPEAGLPLRVRRDLGPEVVQECVKAEGDNYIYEDDIAGKWSFYLWTQRMGAAVEILEPSDLRRQAIVSLKQRIAQNQ